MARNIVHETDFVKPIEVCYMTQYIIDFDQFRPYFSIVITYRKQSKVTKKV